MNFFNNLFKKKITSVVGIDIGSSALKLVQLQKKDGKVVLETYGSLALGPYAGMPIGQATNLSALKTVEVLKDLMREAHTTSTTVGVAIPFSSSLISVMEMPMVSENELATMVPIEARKYIPVPVSEVTLDWSVIPRDELKDTSATNVPDEKGEESSEVKNQRTDVLMVAIHNEAISTYQEIVEKTALDARFFEVEIFSTMRSVVDQSAESVMVFDMGAATTKLYVVERGGIRSSHTINRGSQDITAAVARSLSMPLERAEVMKRSLGVSSDKNNEQFSRVVSSVLDHIFSEANVVLANYQKKYNKKISKVFLVGGGAAMKGFMEVAEHSLQTKVLMGNPFTKVEAPVFLEGVLKTNGPEFAVALGVALRCLQEVE